MAKLTNLIDVTKCTGCRACQVACKQWNQLKAEITPFKGTYQTHPDLMAHTYTVVMFNEYEEKDGQIKWYFRKHQCMHCEHPVCVEVCPRQALMKTDTGAVIRDKDKCIGCQYCVYSCPFQVPKYDKQADKATKCELCYDRMVAGIIPACAKACPTGAIMYGKRDELLAYAQKRINELKPTNPKANVYGVKELGGLNVLYVLADEPEKYGLPSNPQVPAHVGLWQRVVQPYGGWLIGLAAAGAIGSFFSTRLINLMNSKAKGGKTHGH
ncbi:MAG: 4Fe-4S dicluster domain-containing protein [Firmicutes bacterium]|nr:4Fe-4S dicluster domain-containing protein [Bacillota bacterium]